MARPTLRATLEQIVRVLGPNAFGCSVNQCQGCTYEGGEALRLAREALGVAPKVKLPPRPAFVRHQSKAAVQTEASMRRQVADVKRQAAEAKRQAAEEKRERRAWLKGTPGVGDTVEYQVKPKGRWRPGCVVTVAVSGDDAHFKVQGEAGARYYPAAQVRRVYFKR